MKVEIRTEVGILRHEGIEALGDGIAFVIDELNAGRSSSFELVALDMAPVVVDADAAANVVAATEFGAPKTSR